MTRVTVEVTFKNFEKVLTTPDTVQCLVKPPGVAALVPYVYPTMVMSNPSLGLYRLELLLDRPGTWRGRWITSGNIQVEKSWVIAVDDRDPF